MKKQNGITLIALIITIIVMLILVGVTVNVALNGGLFIKAQKATKLYESEKDKEQLLASIALYIAENGKFNSENFVNGINGKTYLPNGFEVEDSENSIIKTGNNSYYISKIGSIISVPDLSKEYPLVKGTDWDYLTIDHGDHILVLYNDNFKNALAETLSALNLTENTFLSCFDVAKIMSHSYDAETLSKLISNAAEVYVLDENAIELDPNEIPNNYELSNILEEYKGGVSLAVGYMWDEEFSLPIYDDGIHYVALYNDEIIPILTTYFYADPKLVALSEFINENSDNFPENSLGGLEILMAMNSNNMVHDFKIYVENNTLKYSCKNHDGDVITDDASYHLLIDFDNQTLKYTDGDGHIINL